MSGKDLSEEIKEYLLGTCNTEHEAADRFEVSQEEALDAIIEAGIECCSGCGWWHEGYEMEDGENGVDLLCPDCFDDQDKDE